MDKEHVDALLIHFLSHLHITAPAESTSIPLAYMQPCYIPASAIGEKAAELWTLYQSAAPDEYGSAKELAQALVADLTLEEALAITLVNPRTSLFFALIIVAALERIAAEKDPVRVLEYPMALLRNRGRLRPHRIKSPTLH